LPGGIADGSGLRVLAIELGESDIFDTGDGHADSDGGGRDSARRSDDGDDLGDGGGSARGQDADVQLDGDSASCGLYLDGHGQRYGDSAGGTDRQLYIFGGAGGRDVWFNGKFRLLGIAGID
jgi:hypothetical protein